MKHYFQFLTIALLLAFSIQSAFSQETTKKWVFGVSANAVNLYSAGGDAPQGELFDEYFNLNDHWNIGFPQLTVSRYFTNNLALSVTGSTNEISKWGQFGNADESVLVDNLKYFALDGMLSYDLSGLFNTTKFEPFIGIGGGYTWIEEGTFNTFSASNGTDNYVGAGTANGTLGFKYWFSNTVGLNAQTTYKHAFEDYLPTHWQHSLGVVVNLGKNEVEEVITDNDEDGIPNEFDLCPDVAGLAALGGCPDSDGDGITDASDLCPNVKGSAALGGCVDTDGDGTADINDKCPNEKGTDNGCPNKADLLQTTPVVTKVVPTSKDSKLYFNTNSTMLDENAKELLNTLIGESTSTSAYAISIKGHTDNVGSDGFNMQLSRNRAEAVKSYLVSKGISANSISISAAGENAPMASNNTNEGRAKNRRAELSINVTSK